MVAAALLPLSGHAQTRLAATNPMQTLPVAPALPSNATVSSTVAPQHNPALQTLLRMKLTPKRIELADMQALPFQIVANDFHTLVGHEVTVADVLAKADSCTDRYHSAGYALSFCYVPTQDFSDGVVRIIAVEGYVGRVEVTGNAGNAEVRLRRLAQSIQSDRPLRQATFEHYTQLMGQIPGIVVVANVPPPTTTDGAAVLQIHVTRHRVAVTTGIETNHPGVQGLINVAINGLTPLGEQFTVSTLYPNHNGAEHYNAASWTQPLGTQGLSWRMDGSNYRGSPVTERQLPTPLKHTSDQNHVSATLRDTLVLDNAHSVVATAGVYVARQADRYVNKDSGEQLTSDSNLHVATLGLEWRLISAKTTTAITIGGAHGFTAFGASAGVTNNGTGALFDAAPKTTFSRVNIEGLLSTQWPTRYTSTLSFSGQYTRDRLAPGEQIAFGGPRFGLAYNPGILSGDYGWGAGYEINRRYDVAQHGLTSLVPYMSAQYARVFANQPTSHVGHLGTIALGIRLSDGKHYTVDVSAAQPVLSAIAGRCGNSVRYNLGVSYSLF